VIGVVLKIPLKNKIGNLYLQKFTSASAWWLSWFYIKLPPHISQQNCAYENTVCKYKTCAALEKWFEWNNTSWR